jgi:hypothetical protein
MHIIHKGSNRNYVNNTFFSFLFSFFFNIYIYIIEVRTHMMYAQHYSFCYINLYAKHKKNGGSNRIEQLWVLSKHQYHFQQLVQRYK